MDVIVCLLVMALIVGVKGILDAVKDTVTFHYHESVFCSSSDSFWDPEISWRRKYKNGIPENGPKFFLSTTVLVFLTDGFHLIKWLNNRLNDLSIILLLYYLMDVKFIFCLVTVILYNIIKGVMFEYFFSIVLKKSK